MLDDFNKLSRRDAIKVGVGAGFALALDRSPAWAAIPPIFSPQGGRTGLILRAIPSTGERLPVVGIGTARNYENPTPDQIPPLRDVMRQFPGLGGRVLDTAPAYGRAEVVAGDIMAELGNRNAYFIATKVSVRGGAGREAAEAQMNESLKRFHTDHIDLMQVWNLSSPETLLPVLDEWKAAKKIRYTGVTTSNDSQYPALEALMKSHKFDFIQIDMAIDNRNAQERILPLASAMGMGVLINLPFGRGRPFQKAQGKPLPGWAKDIDCTTWAQVFLKYIVSNVAVTCVIPGTETVEHLTDNLGAALGRLPDSAMRKRIEADFDAL
ncbi:MAG: aldo/keto reductase [Gemmatimonadetes bacterium]|nr:aldo/keto reductase [Gemmatimonadota bacterium]